MKGVKTDLTQMDCGIARALSVTGDWWSLMIVRDAMRGVCRFGEFQSGLGLAKNILASRLKKLVELGVLQVSPNEDGGPHKDYLLTEKGKALGVVLVALWQWGEEHCFAPGELGRVMVETASGEPLARLTLSTRDGRRLRPDGYTTVARRRRPRSTRVDSSS
jgi:DNA-binding HxlR family transcriptional regulator